MIEENVQAVIQKVRDKQPLIHHLTNQVVMNFSANGLIAFGASPVMAKAPEEAFDMASASDGVLLNTGTLTSDDLDAMIIAGRAANDQDSPVVVDPVGVAATPFRSESMKKLLQNVQPTVIKGNGGEMAHLVDLPWNVKGVDSVGDGDAQQVAKQVAQTYQTIAVVTGRTDIIHTGEEELTNEWGHPYLTQITGAGCLLGSIITACLAVEGDFPEKIHAAVTFYGLAAAYAANQGEVTGAGTFLPKLIDALSYDVEMLDTGA